jgi:hypothetical protein
MKEKEKLKEHHISRGSTFLISEYLVEKNPNYAQICTTALFYTVAPTCLGSSLPSSGSIWIRLSYMKIQIDLVVYHIMWLSGLCAGVSWVRLLCFPAECICTQLGNTTDSTRICCFVAIVPTHALDFSSP